MLCAVSMAVGRGDRQPGGSLAQLGAGSPALLLAAAPFAPLGSWSFRMSFVTPPFMSLCVRRPSSSEPIKSVTLSPSGLKSRNSECQGGKVLGTARLFHSLSL